MIKFKFKCLIFSVLLIFLLSIVAVFSCPVADCLGDECVAYSWDPELDQCVPKIDADGDGEPDTTVTYKTTQKGVCSSLCDHCPCSSKDYEKISSMLGEDSA